MRTRDFLPNAATGLPSQPQETSRLRGSTAQLCSTRLRIKDKTPRNRTSPTMARGIAYALAAVALLCAVLAGAATGDAADDVQSYRVGARDLHSQPACLTSTK